jgi:hypothetical protein
MSARWKGERNLRSLFAGSIAVAALSALTACQSPEPAVKTVEVAPAATAPIVLVAAAAQLVAVPATVVVIAPNPPPQAEVELKPPPPQNEPNAVWQPGHWRWLGQNGAQWEWMAGSYVMPPAGYHQWVPGQWSLQTGGWAWIEGHWA